MLQQARGRCCAPVPHPHSRPTLMTADPAALNRPLDTLRASVAAPPAPPKAPTAPPKGPVETTCPKCGSTEPWGMASWCPRCGYYPAFGTVIDTGPGQDDPAEAISFFKVIPTWTRILIAGIAAIFIFNIAATLLLPTKSFERYLWTV